MSSNYLIIGNDQFMREKEVAKIRDKYLSSPEIDLNFSVHTPSDPEGIMDSLGTMPFISDKRVVVIKDIHEMSDEFAGTLAGYLGKPSETSVLVLVADKDLKKTKFYKQVSGMLEEIGAEKPDANTIKGWIRGFFKKEGVEITPGAVDLIVELKGDDTVGLRMELDKLLSFALGQRVEEEHVEQLVGRNVSETIFKLVDAVNSGNGDWVWRVISDLYAQNKRPLELIGYLGTYIRKIQTVKLLSSRGADNNLIASEIGTRSSYYVQRMVREAKRFSDDTVGKWTTALLKADTDIKTGKKNDHLAVEMVVSGLMGK